MLNFSAKGALPAFGWGPSSPPKEDRPLAGGGQSGTTISACLASVLAQAGSGTLKFSPEASILFIDFSC